MSEFYQRQVDKIDTQLLDLRYQIEALLDMEDGLTRERERYAAHLVMKPNLVLIQGGLNGNPA